MTTNRPIVSIGLPVYNGQRYLKECIESLLAQSFGDFEFIISDNASADNTEEICRDFMKNDKRIRYHRNTVNLGAAKNYNSVFTMAGGKYFKWASHDDRYGPEFLERCVAMLEEAPGQAVLCYPKTTLINENGVILETYDDKMDIRSDKPQDRFRHVFQNLWFCNAIFGLIHTDALRATKLIGSYPGSDTILLAELSLWGQFWEIPEYLFFRRMHSGSSKQANRTDADVAAWFDPANSGKLVLPKCRFFFEYLKAIRRSPLTMRQKLDCCHVVKDEWVKKYWRHMGGECKILLRYKLGMLKQAQDSKTIGINCGQ